MNNNDWIEHKKYVLENLKEIKDDNKEIKSEVSDLKTAFGLFKTKIITATTMASGSISLVISIAALVIGAN